VKPSLHKFPAAQQHTMAAISVWRLCGLCLREKRDSQCYTIRSEIPLQTPPFHVNPSSNVLKKVLSSHKQCDYFTQWSDTKAMSKWHSQCYVNNMREEHPALHIIVYLTHPPYQLSPIVFSTPLSSRSCPLPSPLSPPKPFALSTISFALRLTIIAMPACFWLDLAASAQRRN